MSNPAYAMADQQAQALAENGRIAVVIETDLNNYAEAYDLTYAVHSFSTLSQYEAWLDEHYESTVIVEDPQMGFRKPEPVHEGPMGEVSSVEVHYPSDLHIRREPAPAGMARIAQTNSTLTRIADELSYNRPDLTFAHVADPHGWGSHDRIHVFDDVAPEYDLVVEAWSLPGNDPAAVTYSVHARQTNDYEALDQRQNLSQQEATARAVDLVATMPGSTIHPEDALKQRQAMLTALTTEQLSGPGYTAGPDFT